MSLFSGIAGLAGSIYQADTNADIANMNRRMQQLTNESNERIADKVNATNLQLAREENAFNLDMWNKTNAYNSPAEQAKRLQALGLSSSGIAQSVGGIAAQPLQSANLSNQQMPSPAVAPSLDANAFNLLGVVRDIVDIGKSFNEAKKTKAEADKEETNAAYQPQLLLTDLQCKAAAVEQTRQTIQNEADKHPYYLRDLQYKVVGSDLYNQNMQMALKEKEVQISLLKQNFDFLEKKNEKELEEFEQRINNLIKEGENLSKQGSLIDEQTKGVRASTSKTYADIENVNADTANKNADTKNKVAMHEGILSENTLKEIEVVFQEFGAPQSIIEKTSALLAAGIIPADQLPRFLSAIRQNLKYGYDVYSSDETLSRYVEYVLDISGSARNEFEKSGIYSTSGVRSAGKAIINSIFGN